MNNFSIIPVATGTKWMCGKGVRSSISAIREIINSAEKELAISAYSLTSNEIVNAIIDTLDRGIVTTVYIYTGDWENSGIPPSSEKLLSLVSKYDYLHIVRIDDAMLHAKIVIADRKVMYCGSANLTHHGMNNNYELGLMTDSHESADLFRELLFRLEK